MSIEQTKSEVEVSDKVVTRRKSKEVEVEQNSSDINNAELNLFLLHDESTYGDTIPKFQTEMAACFDLAAHLVESEKVKCVDIYGNTVTRRIGDNGVAVHPGERFLIPTGIIFDIPEGYGMEIYPRSGQSFKKGMTLSNCTANIDADYVEETFVSLTNIGQQSFEVKHGERIAQAKLVKLVPTNINIVKERPKQKTSRNGGFGSTGTGK